MTKSVYHYKTTKGFNVEYSVVGEGEPILILHGGHSNCKEELGYAEHKARGYSVITPSRPGYGKTSKELGENLILACEAYLELMDDLRIPEVHMIAISAGGPSGIHFAARYPQRVRSLILQSAVAHKWLTSDDKYYKSAQIMFRPSYEKFLWSMVRQMNKWAPRFLFKSMISSFSTLPRKELLRQVSDQDLMLFKQMVSHQRSGHGFMIDLEQTGQDMTSLLSAIRCPTLIMHSIHDALVSLTHARYAHQHIPHSQLCELEAWGHLIWLGKDTAAMYDKLYEFLGKH